MTQNQTEPNYFGLLWFGLVQVKSKFSSVQVRFPESKKIGLVRGEPKIETSQPKPRLYDVNKEDEEGTSNDCRR